MNLWRPFGELFRKYFIAGLLVVLPVMGTIWILMFLVHTIETFFYTFVPAPLLPERLIGFRVPGIGLMLTIIIILGTGILTRVVLARQFLRLGEWILTHIPIGRGVYQGIKQLMQLMVGQAESRFSKVVIVEFPQAGSYVYGFVTGKATHQPPVGGKPLLHVFVPMGPNPTSGFLFLFPEDKTKPAGIAVDAAMKLIISGGLMNNIPT